MRMIYDLRQTYVKNGYLYINTDDRRHFPDPPATIKLVLGNTEAHTVVSLVRTTNGRVRIIGLRDWFGALGADSRSTIEITRVGHENAYRLRRTK